jgi:hypothetical protein
MSMLRTRLVQAGLAAAVLLTVVPAASATSLPPNTNTPINIQAASSLSSLTNGYTATAQNVSKEFNVTSDDGSQSIKFDVTQTVYKINSGNALAFMYDVAIKNVTGGATLTQLGTSGFAQFFSGPVDVTYFGNSGTPGMASRPGSTGNNIFFNFLLDSASSTGSSEIDLFVKTQATKTALTGNTSVSSFSSVNLSTFRPSPEPGALTLALLGVPVVGIVFARRLRPQMM